MATLLPRYNEYGDLFGSLGSGLANVLQTVQSHKANQKLESLLANASPVLNEFAETGQYNPALLELLGAAATPGVPAEKAKLVQSLVNERAEGARAKKSVKGPVAEVESLLSALPETLQLDEINQEQAKLRQAMPYLQDAPSRQAAQKQYSALENRKKELLKPSAFSQEAEKQFAGKFGELISEKNEEAGKSSQSLRSAKNTIKLIKNSPPVSWGLRKFADAVGISQLVGESGQILEADFKKYIEGGQKIFGGRLTDSDVTLLKGLIPQVGNTKVANLAIVNLQAAKDWEAVEQNKIRLRLIRENGYFPELEDMVQEEMNKKKNPYLEKMRAYAELASKHIDYDDLTKEGKVAVVNPEGQVGYTDRKSLSKEDKAKAKAEGYSFL